MLAYKNVLEFIKVRGHVIPVAEEKMLLDGLKLVLDNCWTIRTDEFLQLCDLCGLKQKVQVSHEFEQFLEFVFVVSEMFGLDQALVQSYFTVKR